MDSKDLEKLFEIESESEEEDDDCFSKLIDMPNFSGKTVKSQKEYLKFIEF